jgi:hypothetical protein
MLAYMKKTLLFSLLLIPALASAEIYQWIDSAGHTAYGDHPPEGVDATPMNVKPAQTFSTPPMSESAKAALTPDEKEKPADEEQAGSVKYTKLQIISPKNDEPVRSNAGTLSIQMGSYPELAAQSGDQFQVVMDGKPVMTTSVSTVVLQNVDRGTHKLQVQIIDANGQVKKSSPTIEFHMLRVALGGAP